MAFPPGTHPQGHPRLRCTHWKQWAVSARRAKGNSCFISICSHQTSSSRGYRLGRAKTGIFGRRRKEACFPVSHSAHRAHLYLEQGWGSSGLPKTESKMISCSCSSQRDGAKLRQTNPPQNLTASLEGPHDVASAGFRILSIPQPHLHPPPTQAGRRSPESSETCEPRSSD